MQSNRRSWCRNALSHSLGPVLGLAVCGLAAPGANAQVCAGYSISSGAGTFTPGTQDTGNHCDDCVTPITLPFTVNFYGTDYSSATIGSNGTFQFTTTNATYVNVCLPTTTFGATIFPFWDDLYTTDAAGGQGVFTDVSGSPGSQVFVVEWRTVYCCGTGTPINDFEIKFYENQRYFDIIFSPTMADRSSATVGIQDGAGQFVQYVCNTSGPTPGTSLRVNCLSSATAGACCNPIVGTCAITNQVDCTPAANFRGVGTSCPSTCPGQGACCDLAAGTCTLSGAAGCTSPSVFQGVGSVCTTNPCQGACCDPATGGCTMTGSAGCVSPSVYQSAGTSCTPSNPCPQPPPPSNDNCSDVLTALSPTVPPNGGTVNGTTAAATTDGNASCGSGGYRDVYFAFTPAVSGTYTFDTCLTAPSFDTVLSVHSGCPADTSTMLACNDDSCGLLSRIQVNNLVAGTHYIVRVADYTTAAGFVGGPIVLNVVFNVSGACCNTTTGACTISTTGAAGCGTTATYNGDNTLCNSSACPGLGTCCSPAGNCSVQYSGSCPSGFTSNTATTCSPTLCSQTPGTLCEGFETTPVGSLPINWSSTSDGVGTPWVADGTQAHAGTKAVFTNDPATISSQYLVLPPVTAGSSGTLIIDFFSYFDTEATFDGFVVEYSTDGGNSWNDVVTTGTWILNGYNQAAISTNFMSPIAGRPAFSGLFTSWVEHIASIPANTGDQVTFRFLMASDNSVAHVGVWLDDICISGRQVIGGTGVCCRGSTCNSSVTQGACTGGGLAGATFSSSASVCNAPTNTVSPCCLADYNKANHITVQDIFDFLNDWFAGSPYARFGSNGTPGLLAVQNIFDFLNAWFAGGCQ